MEAERKFFESEVQGILRVAIPSSAAAVQIYNIQGFENGNPTVEVALTANSVAHRAAIAREAVALHYTVSAEEFTSARGEIKTLILRKVRRPPDLPPNPTVELLLLGLALVVCAYLFYRVVGL